MGTSQEYLIDTFIDEHCFNMILEETHHAVIEEFQLSSSEALYWVTCNVYKKHKLESLITDGPIDLPF